MVRYRDLLHGIIEVTEQTKDGTGASEDAESTQQPVVRIIEAQERERHRLSRQIHDGPAQSLTNLVLQAEICERLFDVDAERARTELTSLKESVGSTFKKVRGFIMTLRPMMLDDLGLVPTLRRYVESFADNSGVLAHLTVTGKERRLASYKEVTTFRVIQELLNNAHEHSHASSVQVGLDMGEDDIRASVEDDGDGFELTEALTSPEAEQLGLATMRERVEMLGGQMHFDSDLGQGTKVDFTLPVSDVS
jgi:two-component system sensor histidine kinase DegS